MPNDEETALYEFRTLAEKWANLTLDSRDVSKTIGEVVDHIYDSLGLSPKQKVYSEEQIAQLVDIELHKLQNAHTAVLAFKGEET